MPGCLLRHGGSPFAVALLHSGAAGGVALHPPVNARILGQEEPGSATQSMQGDQRQQPPAASAKMAVGVTPGACFHIVSSRSPVHVQHVAGWSDTATIKVRGWRRRCSLRYEVQVGRSYSCTHTMRV